MSRPVSAEARMPAAFFSDDGRGIGNPAGKPIIAEFMDYACPYCRIAHATIPSMLKSRPNLFLVRRDLPLLGADSFTAAAAVMAAGLQGKALAMHDKLMSGPRLSVESIISAAQNSGTDSDAMAASMAEPEFQKRFADTINLSRSAGLNGTPSYVTESGRILEGFGSWTRFTEFTDIEEKS